MTRAEFVRALLRSDARLTSAPATRRTQRKLRRSASDFSRGYRAGVAFALSLLPAEDADLTMADLKGIRAELKDRS